MIDKKALDKNIFTVVEIFVRTSRTYGMIGRE